MSAGRVANFHTPHPPRYQTASITRESTPDPDEAWLAMQTKLARIATAKISMRPGDNSDVLAMLGLVTS